MIVFYTILFILMWKYRYVPLDAYEAWKAERKFIDESFKPGAGIDSPPKRPHLRRVK